MYSKCNVKPGWFEVKQQNFVVFEPKFTNFSAFDVQLIVAVNAVFRLLTSLSILETYAISLKVVRKRANCRCWVGRNEQTKLCG